MASEQRWTTIKTSRRPSARERRRRLVGTRAALPGRGAQRDEARDLAVAQGGLRDHARRHPDVRSSSACTSGGIDLLLNAAGWSSCVLRGGCRCMTMTSMTDDRTKQWYIVHTYSGLREQGGGVARAARAGLRAAGRDRRDPDPDRDVAEMRGGKKVVSSKRFFPGYILVEMNMSDNAWHVVKNTPKVTGFVGAGAKPTPLIARRSRPDPEPGHRGGREAEAEVHASRRAIRSGSTKGRSPASTAWWTR